MCTEEPCEPNYFNFFFLSGSGGSESSWLCERCFHRVYYLCFTKVGQSQQRLCRVFSKQKLCQVFGGFVREATDTQSVSFQGAVS